MSMYDAGGGTVVSIEYEGIPCFTPSVLETLREEAIALEKKKPKWLVVEAFYKGDNKPDVFGLGGDLNFFLECISFQNKTKLLEYGMRCVGLLKSTLFADYPSVAVTRGLTYGGALECALSCDWIVATPQATFSLPEARFGLFPGMGAMSLLPRRIGPVAARRMIETGEILTAKEAKEIGLVDAVVECPTRTAFKLVKSNGVSARRVAQPLGLQMDKFYDTVWDWVNVAMYLSDHNKRKMRQIANAQSRVFTTINN